MIFPTVILKVTHGKYRHWLHTRTSRQSQSDSLPLEEPVHYQPGQQQPSFAGKKQGMLPHIDDFHLASPSVVCKPVAPATPERLLEIQTLRPDNPRPTESESAS